MAMQQQRLDYLDAVRCFALILGVVFHASLSFIPVFIGWAVMDINTSESVSAFVLVSHSFRMALFFLIAGFFSRMSLKRNASAVFFKVRFVRVALPFVVGWFLLRPLLVGGWIMGGQSMQGDVEILFALKQGFANLALNSESTIPSDLFVGTHLWFLYYLMLITLLVTGLRYIACLNAEVLRHVSQWADTFVLWLCFTPLSKIVLIILTALCLWFMPSWGLYTPDKSLIPHIPTLMMYSLFFILGWLLNRKSISIDAFFRIRWYDVIIGLTAIIVAIVLADYEMQWGHPNRVWLKAGFVLSYAIMMWFLVSFSIGLCEKLFSSHKRPDKDFKIQSSNLSRKLMNYISGASYWVYLVHLPVVVYLQIAVAELPFHWALKWACVCIVTLMFCLLSYELFVRKTFIGQILNGNKRK